MSSLTTLGVGGPARFVANPLSEEETIECLRVASDQDLSVCVLGGGSNLLASDAGFDGLVIQSADYAIGVVREGDEVLLTVGAGVEWDELVAFCVDEGFVGLECLSGIPGRVGAVPVQNIGAYGQEVSASIERVDRIDRESAERSSVAGSECGFGYRHSRFKDEWRDRYVISRVQFRLRTGTAPVLRYEELRRSLGVDAPGAAPPDLAAVRAAVLRIRRRKSMLYDPADPNHRSAGSFFVNPVVDGKAAAEVRERAGDAVPMPSWATDDGRVKLSAGWLIERAGFVPGFTFGKVGISTRHSLALVNRGGARAADLVALASIVRRAVRDAFGVTLVPEPTFLGFDQSPAEILG